ncbi:aldo/keto reductase [Pleurocapsales cyanobacterium LEGE 06147]|nr:aldo/keto reductase [Pleurocapsales cyanobacterium LEGE 06147]
MELITLNRKPASILGLAANQTMEQSCVNRAFAAGINYFFFYNLSFTNLLDELKPLLTHNREELMVATGSQSRDKSELTQYLDKVRRCLEIDVVDVFFIEYVSPLDEMSQIQEVLDKLHTWQEKGWIRYVGVTVHNRPLALKLIGDKKCEVLMHRYNMAHRGVEQEVLPAALEARIPIIAFTCTRWGSLLKGHPNWQAPVPQAADCYRYALQHPAVRLALTAPQTLTQLEENLRVLQAPSLNSSEIALWQQYGDLIYGKGEDAFETQWL